jgi:hypothetical protein
LPPTTPFTAHVTAVLLNPWKLAANCCVAAEAIVAVEGATDKVNTATAALALLEESAALVAVIVCEPVVEGAVYIPVDVSVPTEALPPATPSTDQVTAELFGIELAAANCCV